ncbi:MAG: 4-hydroxythreonine-4-phosphate dehydrogenase PdxA [Cyanobacteriota bacterium]
MPKIAITIGDINGIGPEVTLKAIQGIELPKNTTLYIISPFEIIKATANNLNIDINSLPQVIEPKICCRNIEINYGQTTKISGEIAYKSLEHAINMFDKNHIDAIVTAPISKEALKIAGYNFNGHTEVFQSAYPKKKAQMLFVANEIKLLLLTRHIPIKDLSNLITKDLIIDNILSLKDNLMKDFNLKEPKIAICALNPHAGENGSIGNEEKDVIIPAIEFLKEKSINIQGPFPPDSFWKKASNYDCVVALYHDQGLIPLKLLYQNDMVNITTGLPIIRTSPSHGTAYDIAGKFLANEQSMILAINKALSVYKSRLRLL